MYSDGKLNLDMYRQSFCHNPDPVRSRNDIKHQTDNSEKEEKVPSRRNSSKTKEEKHSSVMACTHANQFSHEPMSEEVVMTRTVRG
jgi:hypothetical protein